jgi:hypothetical protein
MSVVIAVLALSEAAHRAVEMEDRLRLASTAIFWPALRAGVDALPREELTRMRTFEAVKASMQASLPITTVVRGSSSQILQPRQVVVQNADAWRALWKEHSATPLPADIPDFTRETIVAVFLGQRPTAGYAVEITGVRAEGGGFVAEYVERKPPSNASTAQVLTSPFHIVRIPTTGAPIVFRERP